jgi:PKD repeat protein
VGLYLIWGQSNAVGRGTIPSMPAVYSASGYDDPYPPVQFQYKIEDTPTDPLVWDFDVAADDLSYIPSGNGTYGIELSFGRRMVALGRSLSLVKMAIGSSSLFVHWRAIAGTYPTADPKLFTQLIAYCQAAEIALGDTISGVLGIHGETDGNNATHAAAYAANLTEFIETFRATFPGTPFFLNRLHYLCGSTHVSTIRAAQDAVAAAVPGVRVFSVDDLALDGAHFTSPAFITMGERFADEVFGASTSTGLIGGLLGSPTFGIIGGIRCGIDSMGGGASSTTWPPVAAFTTSSTALSVTFTDASETLTGSITAWSWNFGDGSSSTVQSPVHAYAAEGTYAVTLTVTNTAGRTASTTTSLTVILWAVDATSSKAVPADATQWANLVSVNSLAVGSPSHVWLFQDTLGNLAAAVGGKTLTTTGTPLYQQTETGWSRKFITSNTGAAGANRFANNATMSATTVSVMLLAFARVYAPVAGHQRMFYAGSSSNAMEAVAGSNVIRIRVGAQSGNGALSHVGQVRPYVLLHDVTNSRSILYSDIEKKSITFAARVGTTVQFQFSLSTDATSNTAFGYAAAWNGTGVEYGSEAAADAAVKALLQSMGFTVTGY